MFVVDGGTACIGGGVPAEAPPAALFSCLLSDSAATRVFFFAIILPNAANCCSVTMTSVTKSTANDHVLVPSLEIRMELCKERRTTGKVRKESE